VPDPENWNGTLSSEPELNRPSEQLAAKKVNKALVRLAESVGFQPQAPRHCEERKRRSNPVFLRSFWIASLSLSSGARSRDPLARNDAFRAASLQNGTRQSVVSSA
jgi:hypothetical protein